MLLNGQMLPHVIPFYSLNWRPIGTRFLYLDIGMRSVNILLESVVSSVLPLNCPISLSELESWKCVKQCGRKRKTNRWNQKCANGRGQNWDGSILTTRNCMTPSSSGKQNRKWRKWGNCITKGKSWKRKCARKSLDSSRMNFELRLECQLDL